MKQGRSRKVLVGLAWLSVLQAALLLSAQSCRQATAPPASTHGVSYALEWKQSKARALAGTTGWEVTNDLGYSVRITRGYLVTRSIELIPCDPQPRAAALRDMLDTLLAPRPVFAGHSAIADPSSLRRAEVESLLQAEAKHPATLYPGGRTYCQAHYLIARADPQATNLPADVDMVDQTLRVEGTFRRPGAATDETFSITTAVANGKLFDLPSRFDANTESAVVVVRRNLDTLFDRVDFATMAEKRIAREMLRNLIEGVEIEVQVSRDPA